MATRDHEFTKVLTGTGAVTGSIVAIGDGVSGVTDDITFGKYIEGGTWAEGFVQNHGANITLANVGNKIIEGPIKSVKLASGTAIIYYNGQLS